MKRAQLRVRIDATVNNWQMTAGPINLTRDFAAVHFYKAYKIEVLAV